MNHVFTHLSLEVHNEATMFKQSVWSEVLPSIKKHGAYTTKDKPIELFGLIDDDEAEAVRRVRNPRGDLRFIMLLRVIYNETILML